MGNPYFLVFFGGDDPQNPEICKSQREITIFLFFWSGKSLFSGFFLEATTLDTRKSANHNGRSLFSCFFGMGNPYFLFFLQATTLETGNLQITAGDHYFLAFLEWEITCSLLVGQAMTLETRKSANHNGISLFSCFFGEGNPYFLLIFLEATTSKKARK